MRKINNVIDYFKFLADYSAFERGRVCHFGLSQNGVVWDDHFDVKWQFEQESKNNRGGRVFVDADGETWTAEEFIDGVEGNYAYPFYIVDTGANYNWL